MTNYLPPGGWMGPAEQIAYGKKLDQEAMERDKGCVKPLDAQSRPVVSGVAPPEPSGVEVSGQVVDTAKYKYDRVKVRGPDGKARYTAGNKDAVAKSLLGMKKEEVLKAATDNGLKMEDHFRLRNDGHFRMIVGQALRSILIKGGTVVLRGVTVKALDQNIDWPKGYAEEEKGTTKNPIRKAPVSANRIKD